MRTSLRFFLFAVGVPACALPGAVECRDSSICDLAPQGSCVAATTGHRWCRYPAEAIECPSGFRWSVEAGDGLTGRCVDEVIPADARPDSMSEPADAQTVDRPTERADASPPDAGVADAEDPDTVIDAAPPDAATSGPVTVMALDSFGIPVLGARVIAHTKAGEVDGSGSTNSSGLSTINVPIGGMVTVARSLSDRVFLITITRVEPGDVLLAVDLDFTTLGGPPVGSLEAHLPGPYGGASSYSVAGSCNLRMTSTDPASKLTGQIYRECTEGGQRAYAIAAARDGELKRVAFASGTADIVSQEANVSMAAWTPAASLLVTVDGVPATAQQTSLVSSVFFNERANVSSSVAVVSANVWQTPVPSSGAGLTAHIDFHASGTEGLYAKVSGLAARVALPATSTHLDGSKLLPGLHDIQFNDLGTSRPSLAWMIDNGLDRMDGGYALLQWDAQAPQPAVQWAVVVPPSTSVKLPELPQDLASKIPTMTPIVVVTLGDAAAPIDSYGAFRAGFVPYLHEDGPWEAFTAFYK